MEVDSFPYACICLFCAAEHHPANLAYVNGTLTRIKRDVDNPSVFASVDKSNENVDIAGHLRSVFILRHVLNLSEEICYGYLTLEEGQLHPDLWFSVCSTCEKTVEHCYALHRKISELKHSLGGLKTRLCDLVHKTRLKNEGDRTNQLPINSVCFDIRNHIIHGLQSTAPATANTREKQSIDVDEFPLPPSSSSKERTVDHDQKVDDDEFPVTLPSPISSIFDEYQELISSPASVADNSEGSEWRPSSESENERSLPVAVSSHSLSVSTTTVALKTKRKKRSRPKIIKYLNDTTEPGIHDGINLETEVSQPNIIKDDELDERVQAISSATRQRSKRKCRTNTGAKKIIASSSGQKVVVNNNPKASVYKCEVCPATFCFTQRLKKHLELHDNGHGRKCLECDWLCSSSSHLKKHINVHHYKHRHLEATWKTDTQEIPYYCDHCHMIFARRGKLIRHFHDAHNSLTLNDCPICDLKFESKQLLKMHCQLEHSQNMSSQEFAQSVNQDDDDNPSEEPVLCPHCTETFISKFNLHFHIAKHHQEALLSCTKCSFKAKKFCHLQTHLYIHTKEAPFVCEICCRGFRRAHGLQCHMKQDHFKELGIDPIKCKECNLTFASERRLQIHLKGVHVKKKEYFCEYCGKGFVFPIDLKRHLLLHTAPRELQYKQGPFFCEFCEAQFNVRQGLYYHVKKLHSDKFFLRCETCGKGYCTNMSLQKHKKSCK